METKVVSTNEQQYKKPSTIAKVAGITTGYLTAGMLPNIAQGPISMKCVKEMSKIKNSTSKDAFQKVNAAMPEILSKTGLDKKGVAIIRTNDKNMKTIVNMMETDMNKGIAKFLPKKLKETNLSNAIQQLKDGVNAFYSIGGNKIVMPEKGMELSFFHEAGHALNANMGKFSKILQKTRNATVLMLPIMLIGLIKTKKAPNEKPEGAVDKTTTFIKENAGKLTFASFLPMLLEEGLATLKGNKLAKEFCPEVAKQVAKSNKFGYLTYLSMATLSSLGVYLGVKIKDKIASKKPIEKK